MTILKFNVRPSPVLPEHRPLYKITQLLLILDVSRSGKSSLLRLHLFNWALKSKNRVELLRRSAENGMLDFPTWGFDPALAIALRYAVVEDLICPVSNGYQIQEKGRRFLKAVAADQEMFTEEKQSLSEIGKRITETMVDAVAKDWDKDAH